MLTQAEADALIAMEKSFVNPSTISIPPGTDQTHELVGYNYREEFFLDLWRGTLRLSKLKFQTRGRRIIVLIRLDVDGAPHTNPDGTPLNGTHIHLYREDYEDRWAYPLNPSQFTDPNSVMQTFEDFCRYCNIINRPLFQQWLI